MAGKDEAPRSPRARALERGIKAGLRRTKLQRRVIALVLAESLVTTHPAENESHFFLRVYW